MHDHVRTGSEAEAEADTGAGPLAALRTEPVNPHGFGGFGPLLALGVLLLLVVLLAPTVAPERIVLRPAAEATTPDGTATTATTAATTATAEPAPTTAVAP